MSDRELVNLKKGETDFNLSYNSDEKELRLSFGYDGKGVDAGVYVDVSAEYFLDKLAEVYHLPLSYFFAIICHILPILGAS